jgi:hypothetical protein
LFAVFASTALWFSPAAAEGPMLLSSAGGLPSSISGTVSGSETSRYNLAVSKGETVRIELSSEVISACSLGIVEAPSLMPFFQANGSGRSIYSNVETTDRTLQVVAYPSRDAFISNTPCRYTVSYQAH